MENQINKSKVSDSPGIHQAVDKLPDAPAPKVAEHNVVPIGHESTANVQDILDAIPFYVLLVDEDHYILEANYAVYGQLGVKREDILGKYCPKIVHGIDEPFHGCPLEEAAEKNISVETELFDPKTGCWVVSAVYPTRAINLSGKRIFLHMVTDVTDRKQAQEKLKTSHQQLRQLSAHLELVREEEKKKIARDLHDETSQLLASLYVYLEAAIETLSSDPTKSKEILKKAQTLSTTILDEIHKLIYELRPSILDELGLIPALNSLANNHLGAAGLKLKFKTSGKVKRLEPSVETALFRIVQETFNNILKHSQATKTDIKVHFTKDNIEVQVKDNGTGFNIQEPGKAGSRLGGMGILGMKERVTLINGSLNIQSNPGQGTQVNIRVPLSDKANDEQN